MGMSRSTAFIITEGDVFCQAAGPNDAGKYSGVISMGEERYRRVLVSTTWIYDSSEDAKKAMRDLIESTKKTLLEDASDKETLT